MVITPLSASIAAPAMLSTKKTTSESRSVYSLSNATPVIVSGNEITDATRTANTQGDGRAAPDSSYGIWESATNTILNGNAATNLNNPIQGVAEWTTTRATTGAGDPVKFGTTAYKITHNAATNADDNMGNVPCSVAGTASTTYTYSMWVYVPSSWDGGAPRIAAPNGAAGTGAVAVDLTHSTSSLVLRDQWQRIWAVVTLGTSGITTNAPGVLRCAPSFPSANKFIYVAGLQVEQKAYPTPYVHTDGASATRNAARVLFPASLLSYVQGWVVIRCRFGAPNANTAPTPISFSDGTNANNINLTQAALGNTAWRLNYRIGNINVGQVLVTLNQSPGDLATWVIKWSASLIGASLNGASFVTSVPSQAMTNILNTFEIGGFNGSQVDGEMFWGAAGSGTLTNADATTINGWGNTDPTWAQLLALNGGAANPTLLWTANNQAIITSLTAATTKVTSESRSISVPATVSRSSVGSFSRSAVATAILNRQSSSGMARSIIATPMPFMVKQTALARSVSAPAVPSVKKVTPFVRSVIAASTLSVVKQTGLVRGLTATPSLSNGKLTSLVRSVVVPVTASGGRLHSFFSSVSVPVTLSVSKVTGMSRSIITSAVLSFIQLVLGKTHARGTATDFSGHTMTTGDLPGHTLTATDGGE